MEIEHEAGAGDLRENPVAGVGARLRAAREALRLELAHVAAETRIPLRHLEAIEHGNFESLPSRAYAIGFSRTFAKALGLNDVEITDAVRAELADGTMRRSTPSSAMEPGDPARLPSAGLAWAAAFAGLVLMVGAFSYYNAYFGAGTEPGSLLTPEPAAGPKPIAAKTPAAQAPASSGPVVLTALEQGVWLRLYEEGGERLVERALAVGETVTVPATAVDPRINTGRPDALAITIGGKPVAKLSDKPITISGVAVSAAALNARGAPGAQTAAATTAAAATAVPVSRPAVRRPLSARRSAPAAAASEPAPEPAPATPASEPAPETASGDGAQE
jgi:cytoskeleton protein RodZ